MSKRASLLAGLWVYFDKGKFTLAEPGEYKKSFNIPILEKSSGLKYKDLAYTLWKADGI